jgi:hypothetical protein
VAGLQVVVQQPLPRFLVFLGSCISLAIIDLVGIFQPDAVEHVAGDVGSAVREACWEAVGEFQLHLGIFHLEDLLEGQFLNLVSYIGNDGRREQVAGKCRCTGLFESVRFWGPNLLRSRWRCYPWCTLGMGCDRRWIEEVVARAFVYGGSLM